MIIAYELDYVSMMTLAIGCDKEDDAPFANEEEIAEQLVAQMLELDCDDSFFAPELIVQHLGSKKVRFSEEE